MKLTFHGGAGSVTGANYLLESGDHGILIDCGLEQGSHYAERQNFEPFAYDPKDVEAVFVTHAHLDHTGRIPKLMKDGFRGTIYSTPPTRDSAELVLIDSEHILKKEADREGRPPLYAEADVATVMSHWKGVAYHEPVEAGPFRVELYDAGHILGSASIKVQAEGKIIVFSGDLGNTPPPIIKPTEYFDAADYCLIESTYGDRVHGGSGGRKEDLEDAIEDTVRAGGVLLIPAFALERTQELLYNLHQLFEERRVPRVPVFIDSPLAIRLTEVYKKYESYFNREVQNIARSGDDILNFPGLRRTLTTEESKEINGVPPPKIIIAGAGMSQGGRILHHELRYLPDPKSAILFIGYQAAGSLGRQIMDGARTVRIFGEDVPVRCRKWTISAYSAHADQPLLLAWISHFRETLKKAFVVQGEPAASEALAQKIRDELAVETVVPRAGETVVL
jgi:metallo-beta-lactamase family protein